jgi:hypothetical protein
MPGKNIYNSRYYRSRKQDISDEFSLYGTIAGWLKVVLFLLVFVSVPLFFVCLQIYFSVGESYIYSDFVANYILICIYCLLIPIFIATTCLMMIKPIYTLICFVYVLLVAGLSFLIAPTVMEKLFGFFIHFLNWVAGNVTVGPK